MTTGSRVALQVARETTDTLRWRRRRLDLARARLPRAGSRQPRSHSPAPHCGVRPAGGGRCARRRHRNCRAGRPRLAPAPAPVQLHEVVKLGHAGVLHVRAVRLRAPRQPGVRRAGVRPRSKGRHRLLSAQPVLAPAGQGGPRARLSAPLDLPLSSVSPASRQSQGPLCTAPPSLDGLLTASAKTAMQAGAAATLACRGASSTGGQCDLGLA